MYAYLNVTNVSLASRWRSWNWLNRNGITVYGFFLLAMCTTVSHWLGIKIEVLRFACSIAECMESHSMCVWPDSRNFCYIVSMLFECFTSCSKLAATYWFLFWPVQQSEYRTTCFMAGGKLFKWAIRARSNFLMNLWLLGFHPIGNKCHPLLQDCTLIYCKMTVFFYKISDLHSNKVYIEQPQDQRLL